MSEHRLENDTLVVEGKGIGQGIAARCICGWASTGHFSSMAASAAFQDHVEAARIEAERGVDVWTCGHTAGAHCAECYRILAAKAHALAEENLALRSGEPTDAQIDAALNAYWSTALAEAKTPNRGTDKVMYNCMRDALRAARVT